MKKKILSVLLIAAMAVMAFAGCGSSNKSTGKVLSVQVGPDPETIDPALNSAVDGGNMILHLFEGLLTVNQDGTYGPGQAETWTQSEDGLTWTFNLRKGLKWSDGSALTANDFVYSWKRVCDPAIAAPYADTVLGMVEGFDAAIEGNTDALNVTAPDAQTLVVKLSAPCPYFEGLASFATLSPVQQATVEKNGDAWAVKPDTFISNGPFMVSEWVPGSYILTKKNPNYWNASAIKLDAIKWNLIEDANAAYSAFKNGEILMIKDVPTEEIPSLRGTGDFFIEPIIGTYYINLNFNKAPFDNVNVRKALNLAIDREYLAETILGGTYSAAPNFMGPGWMDTDGKEFMTNTGKNYYSTQADIEGAKAALAEAGFPNGEGLPTLTYSTNDAGYHKVIAEYLQSAWKEIGVDLKVEIMEWQSFTPARRSGEYEIARNGWVGDYADPSNMIELFYSSNGNNDGKYNNPAFDAAIEKARVSVDKAARSAALHEAEDIMMNDYACIPVAYYNDFWMQSAKIQNCWHTATGFWYFMYADIAE